MNKSILIGGIVILILVALAFAFVPRTSSNEESAVRNTVTSFGNTLKNVSLLSSNDQVMQEMQQNYAPYVSQNLLTTWENTPQQAPGRLTSSPWPDSITIGSVQKQSDGSYSVTGNVEEITSTGPAGSYPVALILRKINGSWLITEFSGYPPQQVQQ